ncbi:MAG: GNAT family N-acetyltransferase [Bacteroidales bacterium]
MYVFRPVTVDNECIHICASLLQTVFPKTNKFTETFLKWEYAYNPVGKIVGFNAFAGDELAAHYVAQPAIVDLFGKERKGLLSLNTATHPNHQGKKLFTTLADMTYKYAAENGFEFVFGVANANSTHGFLTKLGFQHVSPLVAKVGVGEIKTDPEKKQFCFKRIWTEETLQWRMKNPKLKYEISGHRIYATTGKLGIKAIMGNFEQHLFNNIPSSKISSFNPVKLYVGIDNSIIWNKSMYYNVPKKLRQSPLNMIFKDLTGNNLKLDVNNVKFQLIDFDGY